MLLDNLGLTKTTMIYKSYCGAAECYTDQTHTSRSLGDIDDLLPSPTSISSSSTSLFIDGDSNSTSTDLVGMPKLDALVPLQLSEKLTLPATGIGRATCDIIPSLDRTGTAKAYPEAKGETPGVKEEFRERGWVGEESVEVRLPLLGKGWAKEVREGEC